MISSIKTAMISSVLAVGALTALIPEPAQAAGRNGWGIVYHPSDCGRYAIRFYGYGGDGPGSACGYYIDEWLLAALWQRGDRNHNYTHSEIQKLACDAEVEGREVKGLRTWFCF